MNQVIDLKRLLAEGRFEAAEAEAVRRLETNPDDVAALNLAALGALRRRESLEAAGLLERAARLAPADADTHHYLARARETLGDLKGALAADEMAARLAPDNPLVRLHYAAALEAAGDAERALLHFARSVKNAQMQNLWKDAASTSPALRPRVEHAVAAVRRGQQDLFQRLLEPLVKSYGPASLARVFAAIRIYIGEQQPVYSDARQRPTFFYIPDLRPSAYFDRRVFPWIQEYEARYADIRRELDMLLPSAKGRERVFDSEALEDENLRGYDAAPSWNGYYFYRHGVRRADNCSACPITAAALDAIALIRIREHGPEVLYSVFTPGTHLLPHRGVTNARSVSHLPLMVPPDCALRVGGEERQWREGQTLVFDDTYEHEAWNKSRQVRVVLIADVWNPYLTEVERAAVTDVISAIGDFKVAVDGI
jgi:aspartyl/asparaginyl beta-hydroxylase (cupin superfamily)